MITFPRSRYLGEGPGPRSIQARLSHYTLAAGQFFLLHRSLNVLWFLKAKPQLINREGSCVLGDKFLRKHLGSPWRHDGVGGESYTQNQTRGKRMKNSMLAEMELLQA